MMIVRNLDDPEVRQTQYIAHRGGIARMVMTSHFLQSIEFFAWAYLPVGNVLEEHVDEVEEIYFVLSGGGMMKVGDEEREVKPGDAIWIPAGDPHRLINTTKEDTQILVIAAYPR
jgi:mannose-6-phosphate isomerase-like protein (cupin superfamily)